MDIVIKKSFSKDVDKIHDKKILSAINDIINEMNRASTIKDIKHIKKLEGSKNNYRIRISDYRIGLFIDENRIYLVRFLHRKDIYRYFP
jgi:mRNA interferase RelE/StbE